MPAADALQQFSEAMAAIIEADAAVQALTARTTDNVARWRRRKASDLPRLAYIAGPATPAGGIGENYDIDVLIRAEATTAALANALVRAAVESLTWAALDAKGCDAVVLETTYDNPPDDQGDTGTNGNAAIAEADLTVLFTL